MTEFEVTWVIDIVADSPREAAEIALEIQRDPDSTAQVFLARPEGSRVAYQVDLLAEDPTVD